MKIEEKPYNWLDKLFVNRLENNKSLAEKYDKLLSHIKPLIDGDKEMMSLAQTLQIDVNIGLMTQDLILSTALMTNFFMMDKMRPIFPDKIVCHKCGEVVLDVTEINNTLRTK